MSAFGNEMATCCEGLEPSSERIALANDAGFDVIKDSSLRMPIGVDPIGSESINDGDLETFKAVLQKANDNPRC